MYKRGRIVGRDLPRLDEMSGGSGEAEKDEDAGDDDVGVPEETL